MPNEKKSINITYEKRKTKKPVQSEQVFYLKSILNKNYKNYYALSTKPDFKQLVQTCIFLVAPFTLHFTLLTLEFQMVFVFLLEWLTLLPK